MTARLMLLGLVLSGVAYPHPPTLQLEAKIALGEVSGRIDHFALDTKRQRLYVAELGNNSVGVVDLKTGTLLKTLPALKEPQGIGYIPSTDTLYVANGGDGSVRLYEGVDLTSKGQIELGRDADNVRVDDMAHRVFVGYGSGALAVIDAVSRQKVDDIVLRQHPESFQLDATGHIFVNVPEAREIAVIDRAAKKQIAAWPTGSLRANYPMALDLSRTRVVAVFRHPQKIGVFDARDGRLLSSSATCRDADDVFLDAKRSRLYVSCGEGFIDVLEARGESYVRIDRMTTVSGARTAFFAPELDRLMLGVRAITGTPAAIWVYRPST